MMRRIALKGNARIFFLLPLIFAAAFVMSSCDAGDEPAGPTGPGSDNDPVINAPEAGISARVKPSRVTVPDPITGGAAEASMVATFLDADGNPREGMAMDFSTEAVIVTEGGTPFVGIGFNPATALTDTNGLASTTVFVHPDVPPGSYSLVASTGPSNAPTALDIAILYVTKATVETIDTPELIGGGSGTVGITITFIFQGPSTTSLGNPVCYQFDPGDGSSFSILPAGMTSTTHSYIRAGAFLARVRGVKCSDTSVTSDWSEEQAVTIGTVTP